MNEIYKPFLHFSSETNILQKSTTYPTAMARGPQRRGPNAAASVASAWGRPWRPTIC